MDKPTINQLLVSVACVLLACGAQGKGENTQDLSYFSSFKQNPSSFVEKVKLVGELKSGDRSEPVDYSNPPPYRAFSFVGSAGKHVESWVHSDDADAIAWLLDAGFQVIAKNDDAKPMMTDSLLMADLKNSGTYYIAFRDLDMAKGRFTVSLNMTDSPVMQTGCKIDSDCATFRNGAICDKEKLVCVPPPTLPPAKCKTDDTCALIGQGMICNKEKFVCELQAVPPAPTSCKSDDECVKLQMDDLHPLSCVNSLCTPKQLVQCLPEQCGSRPLLPNRVCADGKNFSGPGECKSNRDGKCAWEMLVCSEDKK